MNSFSLEVTVAYLFLVVHPMASRDLYVEVAQVNEEGISHRADQGEVDIHIQRALDETLQSLGVEQPLWGNIVTQLTLLSPLKTLPPQAEIERCVCVCAYMCPFLKLL